MDTNEQLRNIPSVDHLMNCAEMAPLLDRHGRAAILAQTRDVISEARGRILGDDGNSAETISDDEWIAMIKNRVEQQSASKVVKVINCSGIVIHTNLGRAQLADKAADAVRDSAVSNVNLEYDLSTGVRGDRDDLVEELICDITGAESATVVNNNAAAVLLVLNSLSDGQEALVSRGELVEIGGSFRLPEIMAKSGAVLKEVGTTNRTHLSDYENGIGADSGMILSVHTSNYKIIGFTSSPALVELKQLASANNLPLAVDLGAGALVDLQDLGLPHEPTVQETLNAGADLVTISGDKLLGGPQAGIIAGAKELVAMIKKNNLKRALRCDKMTLAALEATLRLYRDPQRAIEKIPSLRHLSRTVDNIRPVANRAAEIISKQFGSSAKISIIDDISRAGSGSLPEVDIPTLSVAIVHADMRPGRLAEWFRGLDIPIIGRVEDDLFRLDMRCIDDEDLALFFHQKGQEPK